MTGKIPLQLSKALTLVTAYCFDALGGLRLNKQRSLLALLGISVGCASVITLLNIGASASEAAAKAFRSMGSDLIAANLTPKTDSTPAPTSLESAPLLKKNPLLKNVAGVALYSIDARLAIRHLQLSLIGTDPQFFSITHLKTNQGRTFSILDTSSTYIVIGASIAKSLSTRKPLEIGDGIEMGDYFFTVIGILQPQEQNALISIDYNNSAFISYEGLRRLRAAPLSSIIASTHASEKSEQAATDLGSYLERKLPTQRIEIQTPTQLLSGLQTQSNVFSYLLSGMGIISLIAGGIGIMNVMFMSVTERRQEIGLRLAIGARPVDIGLLFLIEALCLAVIGSTMGTALGIISSVAFLSLSGWEITLTFSGFAIGITSSLLTGIFFGLHPAILAARLPPARALRDA